jgi:eukaryotic-like serine/threonine-protein kinase
MTAAICAAVYKELCVHAALAPHAHVVQPVAWALPSQAPLRPLGIVMEACDATLQDIGTGLSQAQMLQMAADSCAGLAHLEAAGWMHGDVKPDNILFSATSRDWKLGDFGMARPVGKDLGDMPGTPLFMAPEHQLRRAGYWCGYRTGGKADVWALGMSILCIFVGSRVPFFG